MASRSVPEAGRKLHSRTGACVGFRPVRHGEYVAGSRVGPTQGNGREPRREFRRWLLENVRRPTSGDAPVAYFYQDGRRVAISRSADSSAQPALRLSRAGAAGGGAARPDAINCGTLLHGIEPSYPRTFATIFLMILGISGLACGIPARRAIQVDPLAAFRQE